MGLATGRGAFVRALTVVFLAFLLTVGVGPAAQAASFVGDTPDSGGWRVNGRVYATVIVGDTVYVGGTFTMATSSTGTTAPRAHLAAFSMSTGQLDIHFRADTNGNVRALESDGNSLFVGGS